MCEHSDYEVIDIGGAEITICCDCQEIVDVVVYENEFVLMGEYA